MVGPAARYGILRRVEPVILALAALVGLGSAGGALWVSGRQERRRNDVWRALAARRDGTFLPGSIGPFSRVSPMVQAVVGHVIVRLDLHTVGSGKHTQYFTRARASYALGAGPAYEIRPEGIAQMFSKALGGQDLELGGDRAFDEAFVVRTDDPEGTRAAWTPRCKRWLVDHLSSAKALSGGERVDVQVRGLLIEPEPLDALLDACGHLASFGAPLLERYAALPEARFYPMGGSFEGPIAPRLEVETKIGVVDVEVLTARGAPRLRIERSHGRALPPFSVELGGDAAEAPRGLITDRARPLLDRAGHATLAGSEETLRITWREAPEPAELKAGCDLLAELVGARRSEGAFR